MEFRRLGRSGLQLSVLSFGSWVSFGNQLGIDTAMECLDAAHQAGKRISGQPGGGRDVRDRRDAADLARRDR